MTPPHDYPSRAVVAAEIRVAMARAGIRQGALAAAIGMSQASLSERLNQHRAFTLDHLNDISRVLGVDVFTLLTPPQPPSSERVSA